MQWIDFSGLDGARYVLVRASGRDVPGFTAVAPALAARLVREAFADPALATHLLRDAVTPRSALERRALVDRIANDVGSPPAPAAWRLFVLPRATAMPSDAVPVEIPMLNELGDPEPEAEPLTFEVRVVDELGEGVSGVELVWSQTGDRDSVTTDGSGAARFERPPGPSTASVCFADLDAVRDAFRSRWDATGRSPGAEVIEPAADVSVVFLRSDLEGRLFALVASTPHTISVQPYVMLARVFGLTFETSKSFLLPEAIPSLKAMRRLYDGNPDTCLLIVGHTDTAGSPGYNDPLSLERADAMSAYLRDDVDAWLDWYGSGKPDDKRWGSREDGLMMTALLGADEDPEVSTTLSFQRWWNAELEAGTVEGEALVEDGAIGPKTRRALVTAYQQQDDTTLPEHADLQSHGCGENFPLDASGEELDTVATDGTDDRTDRRVDLFFFDAALGVQPAPAGSNSQEGSKEYPEWRARARVVHEYRAGVQVPIFDWDDDLDAGMPGDLELTLRDDEADMTIAWRDGVRAGARRRFVFGELSGELPCTLVARTGGSEITLLDAQTITSADLPIRWETWLEDLVGTPGPAEDEVRVLGPMPDLGPEEFRESAS